MWLTTSKNAPKELKKEARTIASALPAGQFYPRGETKLERIAELAKRTGERTLLVIMAGDNAAKPASLFSIRSRHLVLGGDGKEEWSWDARSLAAQKMKTGALASAILGEDPYVIGTAKKDGETSVLVSFLGLENHPLAEFDDEPREVKVEAKKAKKKNENSLKLAAGKELLLSLEYEWAE